MEIDHPTIVALRAKVKAASDEFLQATAFHEAWKPAAYDDDLHVRMGNSFATNTFFIIRQALRRETLLAVVRLWDKNDGGVSLPNIARVLGDSRVMDVLAAECAKHWSNVHVRGMPDPTEEHYQIVAEAARRSHAAYGEEASAGLRKNAELAIAAIAKYQTDGIGHATFKHLRTLRNEHLAHRQITPTPVSVENPDINDKAIEDFYNDLAEIIRLLRAVAEGVDYRPEETAVIYRRHAGLFWAGVRGESTEGHPNYRPRQIKPPRA